MLRPVIMIGCGGSGQKAVRYIRDAVRRQLDHNNWEGGIPNAWQFIGLDTLGHEMGRSDIPATDKVRMITDLLDAGLEDHILLSSDQGNVRQFKHYYGHGWSSVLMQFVPKLRYAQIPEATIRRILVDNPRRFLAFQPVS